MKYSGSSWSVYGRQKKIWQQTWVDNMGGYIALTGKYETNEMTLTTPPQKITRRNRNNIRNGVL